MPLSSCSAGVRARVTPGAGWEPSTVPGRGLVSQNLQAWGRPAAHCLGQDRRLGAGAGPALSVVAQTSGRGISFSVALK